MCVSPGALLLNADKGSSWGTGWKQVKVPSVTLRAAFYTHYNMFKYFTLKIHYVFKPLKSYYFSTPLPLNICHYVFSVLYF